MIQAPLEPKGFRAPIESFSTIPLNLGLRPPPRTSGSTLAPAPVASGRSTEPSPESSEDPYSPVSLFHTTAPLLGAVIALLTLVIPLASIVGGRPPALPSHDPMDLRSLQASPAPGLVNLVVEIPAGSSNKYEYNAEAGLMALDRVLHSSVRYPFDYGFVPNTMAEDGAPSTRW